MSFDQIIDRRGTHCVKWDKMEALYGVSPDEGIAMWVADMEFRPPACVQDALQAMLDHGVYGYFGDESAYLGAICWWMENRHGWRVDPAAIFTTHGLVNGTAMCVDAFTAPGDGVVLFTPVYHAFARVIRAAGREVVECEMPVVDGQYTLDFDAWDAQMKGHETMLVLCSPHNPGGRVWTRAELEAVAAFAKRHDLILVSDEIHHDLVMPGQAHTPMALIDGIADRLVMMTAATKTFNIAGAHVGNGSSIILRCGQNSRRGWRPWGCRPIPSACSWGRRPIRPKARHGSTMSVHIWPRTRAFSMRGSTRSRVCGRWRYNQPTWLGSISPVPA